MSSGRSNKIVGQTGEYLVAAELSRRGYICTTFTGNVPHFDLVATNEAGGFTLLQVKSSLSDSWQFSKISDFCEVHFKGHQQVLGQDINCPVENLVVVFVRIGDYGQDSFYLLRWEELRSLLIFKHKKYLDKHGGIRPKNPTSLHVGLKVDDLTAYCGNWELVNLKLGNT